MLYMARLWDPDVGTIYEVHKYVYKKHSQSGNLLACCHDLMSVKNWKGLGRCALL